MVYLRELAQNIARLYQTNIPMLPLTQQQQLKHDAATKCALCENTFNQTCIKVCDHNHLTGLYRGAYCSKCNLNIKLPSHIPVLFHNLSGYDSHFLVQTLGMFRNRISLIPDTSEKFISFSEFVDTVELRFLDSFRCQV